MGRVIKAILSTDDLCSFIPSKRVIIGVAAVLTTVAVAGLFLTLLLLQPGLMPPPASYSLIAFSGAVGFATLVYLFVSRDRVQDRIQFHIPNLRQNEYEKPLEMFKKFLVEESLNFGQIEHVYFYISYSCSNRHSVFAGTEMETEGFVTTSMAKPFECLFIGLPGEASAELPISQIKVHCDNLAIGTYEDFCSLQNGEHPDNLMNQLRSCLTGCNNSIE